MKEYIVISIISFIALTIVNLYTDREYLCASVIISDICEGMIIGLSWIISIPILAIGNMIISIISIIQERNKKEE